LCSLHRKTPSVESVDFASDSLTCIAEFVKVLTHFSSSVIRLR
jgi:hypothetical protein